MRGSSARFQWGRLKSLFESTKIDGARELTIYFKNRPAALEARLRRDRLYASGGQAERAEAWDAKYEARTAKCHSAGLDAYIAELPAQVNTFVETYDREWRDSGNQ